MLKVIGGGDGELHTRGSGQYRTYPYRYCTGRYYILRTIFKADMDDVAQAQLNPSSRGASQAAHPRQAPRSVGKQEGLDMVMDDVRERPSEDAPSVKPQSPYEKRLQITTYEYSPYSNKVFKCP